MKFSQAKGRVPLYREKQRKIGKNGKTGKMAKQIPLTVSGKTQEIRKFCQNTGKHRDFFFLENIGNFLILKIKDIALFAKKIPNFS